MEKIISNTVIAPDIHKIVITAPRISKAWKPGQFIIVHYADNSERIPLTVCKNDRENGLVTLIVQGIGEGTKEICSGLEGTFIKDVVGPLGKPAKIDENLKNVLFIAGGIGIAPLLPVMTHLYESGISVTVLVGTKSANTLILKEDMLKYSNGNLMISTDDGTLGKKGFVISLIEEAVSKYGPFDRAFVAGPVRMMAATVKELQKFKLPSTVSLNPIMIDGTGMCGGCRVTVGGETKFACIDGPEFEGDLIDFDQLIKRLSSYNRAHKCKLSPEK
ncbi:MAG: sulfide/dihydroorotate dehydrogenase-like FAD/NAD-binding protein [bacterium]